MKFLYFLLFFLYLNNIAYAEFKPYTKIDGKFVKILVVTFPSFDYIEYNNGYYEAIPQYDNIYSLTYKFDNKEEMYKIIDKSYPKSKMGISFYQEGTYSYTFPELYKAAIVEDYR